jgi:hypothetical protein
MLCHGSLEEDGAFLAFLLQAPIILIEDHVISIGKSFGLRDSLFWRLVGFAWTILAIGVSLDSWIDSQLRHGMWVQAREPDWFGIGPRI